MTSPLDEKGRADKLVQIARIIARNIDEERFYDAPAFQRAAQDVCAYLSIAPAPDELEVVAWRWRSKGVTQYSPGPPPARMPVVAIEPLVTEASASTAIKRLQDEVDRLTRSVRNQTDAGYCDADYLSDGPPFKCGWQRQAETAEAEVKRLTEEKEALRRKLDLHEAALSFVRRWAVQKEGNGTSAEERLSAIAHHPAFATLNSREKAE